MLLEDVDVVVVVIGDDWLIIDGIVLVGIVCRCVVEVVVVDVVDIDDCIVVVEL